MAYKAAKKDIKQSAIQKALSEVMANTIDWEGGRKNRKSVKSKHIDKDVETETAKENGNGEWILVSLCKKV